MEHEVKINGHRFKISIRDVVQVVATGLSIVAIYFISSGRISTAEGAIKDLYKKHDEEVDANKDISRRVDKMDETGTRRSHETDAMQQQMIDYNKDQITEINRGLNDLRPKVDKIDTNVLWLMAKQLEKK